MSVRRKANEILPVQMYSEAFQGTGKALAKFPGICQ